MFNLMIGLNYSKISIICDFNTKRQHVEKIERNRPKYTRISKETIRSCFSNRF